MQISNKIQRYLDLAKNQAEQSDHIQRHGSVLIKGGCVINTSYNKATYNKFANRFNRIAEYSTCHAEIRCLLGISKEKTEGGIMIVVRINNKGELVFSRPCSMCKECCHFCGIKKIYYSIDNETIGIMRLN